MTRLGGILIALALIISISAAVAMAIVVFGVAPPPFLRPAVTEADFGPPQIELEAVSFSDLIGWRRDDQTAAIPAFLRSCGKLDALPDDAPANPMEALGPEFGEASLSGVAADWRAPCEAARAHETARYADPSAAAAAARTLFEFNFRPVKIVRRRRPLEGGPAKYLPDRIEESDLLTGYFEPVYEASTFKTRQRSAPVLPRPPDLVTVDLGAFRKEFAGERIAGYVEEGALMPYADHGAIDDGALDGAVEPVAWVDPNDLFFLQVQGSGRLRLPNGRELRVGFDGHNGRPYTSIGRILVDRGILTLDNVSMQTIRNWLDAAPPEAARELRQANESYVFFRILDDLPDPMLGPFGADKVQLTPGRSLAVDRRYYAMGAPVWLAVPETPGRTPEIYRLVVAQDAGGAIKGPLRADIFLGSGERAGDAAGRLRAEGEIVVLAPRAAVERLETAGKIVRARPPR